MRAIVWLAILTTLAGCAGALPDTTDTLRDFCLVYEPVYTSPADTEATRAQVDRNNVAWLALGCAAPSAPDKPP